MMRKLQGVRWRADGGADARSLAHRALERVDLAGVGLDLVAVLHALLLGLAQGVAVLVDGLVQVGHL